MFGERLKLARKRSGLSLRALSSRINGIVSAQAIGKYERGEMMPSSNVAIALAEALGVSLSYLLSPSNVSLESVEFRKLSSTKARERAAVEGEVLDHVDRYLQVEELLGISDSMRDEPDDAPYSIEAVEDAEPAAMSTPHRLESWRESYSGHDRTTGGTWHQGLQVELTRICGWAQLPCTPGGWGRRARGGLFHREVSRKTAVHDRSRIGPHGLGHSLHGAGRESLPSLCRRLLGAPGRAHS